MNIALIISFHQSTLCTDNFMLKIHATTLFLIAKPIAMKLKRLFFTNLHLASFFFAISFAQVQTGKASFYADKFEGIQTASGEKYRHNKLTGAHKTLPFGTKVRVTNLANDKTVEVTINDRGPYVEGRIIDLSKAAAEELGFLNKGLADVKLEMVDPGDGKVKDRERTIDQVTVEEKEFYEFEITQAEAKGIRCSNRNLSGTG